MKDLGLMVPQILGGGGWAAEERGGGHEKLTETGGHLKHVSILESSATSCLHPHLWLLALPIVWAVVQVLGLDEIQALSNLGGLKLDKVQVACNRHAHLFASARLFGCLSVCHHETHKCTIFLMCAGGVFWFRRSWLGQLLLCSSGKGLALLCTSYDHQCNEMSFIANVQTQQSRCSLPASSNDYLGDTDISVISASVS